VRSLLLIAFWLSVSRFWPLKITLAHSSGSEETKVVVHKADQPNLISDFADADILNGEHATEIDFAPGPSRSPSQ
jgi:hypothetical protein